MKAVNGRRYKYEIAIVPTIVIFDDGEEVKRFQADLSFKMVATKEEVKRFQADLSFKMVASKEEVKEYIEELIISKF